MVVELVLLVVELVLLVLVLDEQLVLNLLNFFLPSR